MKECLDCGSAKIVRNATAIDMADYNITYTLGVAVDERPDAMFFKQRVHSGTRAEICGDCGFVQIFAVEPKKLWFAYQSSQNDVE